MVCYAISIKFNHDEFNPNILSEINGYIGVDKNTLEWM